MSCLLKTEDRFITRSQ